MNIEATNHVPNYIDSSKSKEISNKVQKNVEPQRRAEDMVSSVNALAMSGSSINLEINNTGVEDVNQQQLKQAVEQANAKRNKKTRCEFQYHESINRVSIKVFNSDTDEVIREIPAEETIEMIEKLFDLAGLMVDERR